MGSALADASGVIALTHSTDFLSTLILVHRISEKSIPILSDIPLFSTVAYCACVKLLSVTPFCISFSMEIATNI